MYKYIVHTRLYEILEKGIKGSNIQLQVLLATNFYTHFGLENANFNEYDTDLMLEYEENDTYKEFKEFFFDVLPEFEKFGRIVQFKVSYSPRIVLHCIL